MLSYALAIAVATISLVLFLTAFLMSDIHRKDDFLWSGVGFIYALVLWFCARNITGAVLLGQAAATAVLVSSSWQTLKLRRAIANPDRAAEIYNFSVWQKIQGLLKRKQPQVKSTATPVETPVTPKVTEREIAIPDTTSEATESVEQAAQANETATKVNAPKAEPEIPQRSTTPENQVKTDSQAVVPTDDGALESKENIARNPTSSSKASQPKNNTAQREQTPKITSAEPQVETKDNITQNPTSSSQASQPKNNTAQREQTPKITSAEPQVETKDNITEPATSSTAPIEPQVEPEPTTVTPASKAIAEEDDEPKAQTTSLDIKPVSDSAPQTRPTVSKTSSLDSLETVEVAEVLEASSQDVSLIQETDDSSIIEVTTTEINITTEVKKVEQEPDNPESSRES